jgi:hypothetical protein
MLTRIVILLNLSAFVIGSVSTKRGQTVTGQRLALTRARDWKGDFSGMVKRRMPRILVPYCKTLFFVDRGRQMGVVAEFGRALEDWNQCAA